MRINVHVIIIISKHLGAEPLTEIIIVTDIIIASRHLEVNPLTKVII